MISQLVEISCGFVLLGLLFVFWVDFSYLFRIFFVSYLFRINFILFGVFESNICLWIKVGFRILGCLNQIFFGVFESNTVCLWIKVGFRNHSNKRKMKNYSPEAHD